MNNDTNTFKAEKLKDMIEAMSPDEQRYILKFIPLEYCMDRVTDELRYLKKFQKDIKKIVIKED